MTSSRMKVENPGWSEEDEEKGEKEAWQNLE